MNTDILAVYTDEAPPMIAEFSDAIWRRAHIHHLAGDWRGDPAPSQLDTEARILWTDEYIFIGFTCAYTELDADSDDEVDVSEERPALWDRDVCEAFIRSPIEPAETNYLEFEVAPTGQWCDLKIDRARMTHDWQWRSRMQTAAAIDEERKQWCALMAIPFDCFGTGPQAGEIWAGNLFRVSRLGGERRYLAYSPTLTERPNYHVPGRFVRWRFSRK